MSITERVLNAVTLVDGWTSAQAVIDVIDDHDPQMVKFELRALTQRGRLQSRSGIVGMEYALPETPAPGERAEYRPPAAPERTRTAKPSAPRVSVMSLEDASREIAKLAQPRGEVLEEGRAETSAAIAKTIAGRVIKNTQGIKGIMRQRILDAITRAPIRSKDLCAEFGITDVSVCYHTNALRDAGLIERPQEDQRFGAWRLVSRSPQPAAVHTAPADQAQVSDKNGASSSVEALPPLDVKPPDGAAPAAELAPPYVPEIQRDVTDVTFPKPSPPSEPPRFAMWSDGTLELIVEGEQIILSRTDARSLIDYLDQVCATNGALA